MKTNLHGCSSRAAGDGVGSSAFKFFPTGSGFSRAAAGGGLTSPSASGASSGSVRLTLGSGGVGAAGHRSDSRPLPLGTPTLMETAAGTARGAAGRTGGSSDCQKKRGQALKLLSFLALSYPFRLIPFHK